MPIDVADLQSTLKKAITAYNTDPNQAVRGGEFIGPIHEFCARELIRRGLAAENVVPNPGGGGYLPPRARDILESARAKVRHRLRGKQNEAIREQLTQDLNKIEDDTRRGRLRVLGGYMQKEIDVCYMI